ncbi:MAG: ABC transporter ATP-binding protein/permease [Lachnospiraceae bacterium]|nr:ABC transporter ATP-binding protein/permease [Lachnospiraceae bacterium]
MQKCMQKADLKISNIRIFWRFMGLMGDRLPIYLGAILVSTIGDAGRRIANSYLVNHIVTAAQKQNTDNVLLPVLGNFMAFVLCLLLWRFGIIRYNIEGRTGVGKVEKLVFSKAMRLPMSYYENNHSSDFMSRLIFDTQKASDIYTSRLRRLLAAVLSTVMYLVPMFYFSWELTLCMVGISLLAFAGNSLFAKPMKEVGSRLSDKNKKMLEKLTSILSGMDLIKIFPVGTKLTEEYEEANREYFHIQKKTNRLSAGLESLNQMLDLFGALAFLGIGVWFVSLGRVSLGELTALYSLYGTFRYAFLEIGQYLPQMMNCIANAEKIFELIDMAEEPEQWEMDDDLDRSSDNSQAKENEHEKLILSMQNVSFSYKNSDRKVLDQFSMEVRKGSYVAVVGESGCGKSTLAKLLLGFYPVEVGNMMIGGKPYRDLTLKEVREQIAYVPQEPYLYEVSIAENIAYGRCGVSREEIITSAKAANAHEFIIKLPNGYDTKLGERGNTLSGGERQRIAIARAIIRNTPIMILDEATSALDNESESLVQEAIKRLRQDRTILMIAHRPGTIAAADEVVQLGM